MDSSLPDSPGLLFPLAGQRRLWEAVKRRKVMCKRKSWMSKVREYCVGAEGHTKGLTLLAGLGPASCPQQV